MGLYEHSVLINPLVSHNFPMQIITTWALGGYTPFSDKAILVHIISHASCFRVIVLYTRSPFLRHGLASCHLTSSTRYDNHLCPLLPK
jgi:hypothetical protein